MRRKRRGRRRRKMILQTESANVKTCGKETSASPACTAGIAVSAKLSPIATVVQSESEKTKINCSVIKDEAVATLTLVAKINVLTN